MIKEIFKSKKRDIIIFLIALFAIIIKSLYDKADFKIIILSILMIIIYVIIKLTISFFISYSKSKIKENSIIYCKYDVEFDEIQQEDIKYYREIPYKQENFDMALCIAYHFKITNNPINYIGIEILKWVDNDNITIINKNNQRLIKFNNSKKIREPFLSIFNELNDKSEKNILTIEELNNWICKNYKKITKAIKTIINIETEKLINKKFILKKSKKYYSTDKLDTEAKKLIGLKKYLQKFSKIEDKSTIEINLWKEYLMYAYMFNISKKVIKDLEKFVPDFINIDMTKNIITTYNNVSQIMDKIILKDD